MAEQPQGLADLLLPAHRRELSARRRLSHHPHAGVQLRCSLLADVVISGEKVLQPLQEPAHLGPRSLSPGRYRNQVLGQTVVDGLQSSFKLQVAPDRLDALYGAP